MFKEEWQQVNPDIRRKILQPGEHLMSMLIEFKKGGFGPLHAHPHEQLGFVVRGRVRFVLDGKEEIVGAGEQVWVPCHVPHSVLALEDTLLLETFTPLREDLLASIDPYTRTETKA